MSPMPRASSAFAAILRHPLEFVWRVLRGLHARQGLILAGALAYNALLSAVPLFALLVIGLSHVVPEDRLFVYLERNLRLLVPGMAGDLLSHASGFLENRDLVGGIAIAVMLFFSSIAFTVLENAMSVIFYHRTVARRRHPVVSAIIPYCYMLVLGLGLAAFTVLGGVLQSPRVSRLLPVQWFREIAYLDATLVFLVGLSTLVALFTSIYKVMPIGRIRLRHALAGGVVAAVFWEATRRLLIWYFDGLSMVNILYGSIATTVVALLYLEISGMILLLGAQVVAVYERLHLELSGTEVPAPRRWP
jgi:membrane protein